MTTIFGFIKNAKGEGAYNVRVVARPALVTSLNAPTNPDGSLSGVDPIVTATDTTGKWQFNNLTPGGRVSFDIISLNFYKAVTVPESGSHDLKDLP